jgi:hypothetical protein
MAPVEVQIDDPANKVVYIPVYEFTDVKMTQAFCGTIKYKDKSDPVLIAPNFFDAPNIAFRFKVTSATPYPTNQKFGYTVYTEGGDYAAAAEINEDFNVNVSGIDRDCVGSWSTCTVACESA